MPQTLTFTATTTRGAETVLAEELADLGITRIKPDRGAVRFRSSLEQGYQVCLWSRISSRVLLELDQIPCPDAEALYAGVRSIDWNDHLGPQQTLAVDFVGGSDQIRHSQFGARKTKDAIVDTIRDRHGSRPSVDLRTPDLRINVHLRNERATISLDLSGDALHLRGMGRQGFRASIKETLAAALLRIAGWPRLSQLGAPLLDPFCGSGTFLIEAAGMTLDHAPGLERRFWGFLGWAGHRPAVWRRVLSEARSRARATRRMQPVILGADISPRAIQQARFHVEAAGLSDCIQLRVGPLVDRRPPRAQGPAESRGLLITNPPYGVRLGEIEQLRQTYRQLGDHVRRYFLGWQVAILSGNPTLAKQIGLRPRRRHVIHNGPIECRLLEIPISEEALTGDRGPGWRR